MHRVDPDGTRTDLSPPLIGFGSQVSWQQESQQHSQQTPWILTVNDQFQGVVWLPDMSPGPVMMNQPQPIDNQMPQGDGGSHDPRMVALDVLAHIPLPPVVVRMNPDLGMVALPGWFWVDGYDGHDVSQSRTVTFPPPAPGLPPTSFTVTVRIWPTKYDWDFGDGTAIETHSLGKRYPDQSDVQHKYEFSSLPFPNGFAVRLSIEFAAEFRVNGGGPQPLPPIRHTWENDFRVQELQPVLTQH